MSINLDAFLAMVGWSEGTRQVANSDDGYRVLVGGTVFDSYADHPRIVVQLNPHLKSSAAGRYQILERYYDSYRVTLHLNDFSPYSQDAIATQMICEHYAFGDVIAGRFDIAIGKVRSIWASLPNAGYSQHENNLADLRKAFIDAGGQLAA